MRTLPFIVHESDPRAARYYLDMAARAALRAAGDADPNPLVGAAIVQDGRLLALAHHRRFGGLHAEREAFSAARADGKDVRGSTIFVTLEPCNGIGQQPPCVEAIIESDVARVVFAANDPNPSKAGGAAALRSRGIRVDQSDASLLALELAAPFLKRLRTDLPWVIAKWGQTLDGRVATRTGASQWITGAAARRAVHRIRGRVDAVMVGISTVLADDPMLTARGLSRIRRPSVRIILDSSLRTPPTSKVVMTARPHRTILACLEASAKTERADELRRAGVEILVCDEGRDHRVDASDALRRLRRECAINTILVEGGPTLLGSFIDASLVDEVRVHIATSVMGDASARGAVSGRDVPTLDGLATFRTLRVHRLGPDTEIIARR